MSKIAYFSLFLNLAFGCYTGMLGITGHSWWFLTLAAYYVVLSVMRFAVLLSGRRQVGSGVSAQFIERFVGVFFMVLAVILAGTTYLAFSDSRGVRHHEIVMITIALYAFWKVIFGIIQLVKSRNANVPTIKTLRNISFADALVSIFSLQRSMLVTFDGMSPGDISLLNALTGSAVYLAVFLLGLNLIGGKKITMAKSKLVEVNKKAAAQIADSYQSIEKSVVEGYRKVETGVVTGYTKLEDRFIERFLMQDGETVEEARERLKRNYTK